MKTLYKSNVTDIRNDFFIFIPRNLIFVKLGCFLCVYNCVGTAFSCIHYEHSFTKISILKHKINPLKYKAEKHCVLKTSLLIIAVYSGNPARYRKNTEFPHVKPDDALRWIIFLCEGLRDLLILYRGFI